MRSLKLEFPICFLATEEYTPEYQTHHLYFAFRPRPEPERAPLGHCRDKKAMTFRISQRFHEHLPVNSPPSSRLVSHRCRAYPAGSGKASMRRSMLPNRRHVRWIPCLGCFKPNASLDSNLAFRQQPLDLLLPGNLAILNVILAEGCLSLRTGAEMWH